MGAGNQQFLKSNEDVGKPFLLSRFIDSIDVLYSYRLSCNFELKGVKLFYDLSEEYSAVAVVGIKGGDKKDDESEDFNTQKESIRRAAAEGASELQKLKVSEIIVDGLEDPESAAEGVTLKLWEYNEYKKESDRKHVPDVKLYSWGKTQDDCLWNVGTIKGDAQNVARRLTDSPANLMTPVIFAQNAVKLLDKMSSVEVHVRDKKWAEMNNMNTFLSVAKGSSESPVFLEIIYRGKSSGDRPVVLVGKGITFDTGGINIKSTPGMADMRGDKGGAASVLAATYGIAKLNLPINVTTLIPLCENMPGSNANKPGDVIKAMNGKTVRIDNTDAEGRLILADALHYSKNYDPLFVVDVATLTGAMAIALGTEATGVFTNSNCLWEKLQSAGRYTGDRVWRLPLWKSYGKDLKSQASVDLTNIGKNSMGGACSAAAFLREFVPDVDWIHLDIAGVMGPNYQNPYIGKGMTGRPTRTLIEFLKSMC
ncbi:hypothetical protein RUM44_001018 [Polyplax serrata]|uniref:Cytosol aminopeptidase n=1 Tax=Polyplax serrata TaxID=468196 RepID=A0ABR1B9D9_POLSC